MKLMDAKAVNQQEDTDMTRGLKNNNPGNIRHSATRWQGEIEVSENNEGLDASFKTFMTMAYGYRAMFKLLHNYAVIYNLHTLEQMISRWAPPSENNTRAYISAVSLWSGVASSVKIDTTNPLTMIAVVSAMSRMENGVAANIVEVNKGWELFCSQL